MSERVSPAPLLFLLSQQSFLFFNYWRNERLWRRESKRARRAGVSPSGEWAAANLWFARLWGGCSAHKPKQKLNFSFVFLASLGRAALSSLLFPLFFAAAAARSPKKMGRRRKSNQSIPLLFFNSQSIALFISAIDGVDWKENEKQINSTQQFTQSPINCSFWFSNWWDWLWIELMSCLWRGLVSFLG